MHEWRRQVQQIVDAIDESIAARDDEALTLRALAELLGYSEFHTTRRFKEVSGMPLRDYLRGRRLAFALKEVRDGDASLLDIALDHGFSSHEAFTRAFKRAFGVTPSAYRADPRPVVLRTKITAFDRYVLGMGEIGMTDENENVEPYFITVPAHRFLHVANRESNGYWDFCQKQNEIPGQDMATVCDLLDSVKGKLDDVGGAEANAGGGQVMAYVSDPAGRLCAWGFPRVECLGARACPATGRARCRRTCASWTWRRASTPCSSTGPSTTSARCARWRARSRPRWPRSRPPITAGSSTRRRGR